jgi:hypothetical protein
MGKLADMLMLTFVGGLMFLGIGLVTVSSYAQNETSSTANQSGSYNATGLEDTSAADEQSGSISGRKGR